MKSLKGVVVKVCSEENGHVVMMGLFDSVDDTVLLKKVILAVSSHDHSKLSCKVVEHDWFIEEIILSMPMLHH